MKIKEAGNTNLSSAIMAVGTLSGNQIGITSVAANSTWTALCADWLLLFGLVMLLVKTNPEISSNWPDKWDCTKCTCLMWLARSWNSSIAGLWLFYAWKEAPREGRRFSSLERPTPAEEIHYKLNVQHSDSYVFKLLHVAQWLELRYCIKNMSIPWSRLTNVQEVINWQHIWVGSLSEGLHIGWILPFFFWCSSHWGLMWHCNAERFAIDDRLERFIIVNYSWSVILCRRLTAK